MNILNKVSFNISNDLIILCHSLNSNEEIPKFSILFYVIFILFRCDEHEQDCRFWLTQCVPRNWWSHEFCWSHEVWFCFIQVYIAIFSWILHDHKVKKNVTSFIVKFACFNFSLYRYLHFYQIFQGRYCGNQNLI